MTDTPDIPALLQHLAEQAPHIPHHHRTHIRLELERIAALTDHLTSHPNTQSPPDAPQAPPQPRTPKPVPTTPATHTPPTGPLSDDSEATPRTFFRNDPTNNPSATRLGVCTSYLIASIREA